MANAYNKGKTVKHFRLRKAVIDHIKCLKSRFLMSAVSAKKPAAMWQLASY